MKFNRVLDERGMAAVIFVTITFGLLGFLAIYFDLSSYVAAKSTVDAAANAVMRCLIPTDAGCVKYTLKKEPSPPPEWMGYERGGPPEVIVWHHDKNYSGSMNQKTWGAEYTTYESNWTQRQVEYNTYSVPVKEFKPVYGRYRPTPRPKEWPFYKEVVHYAPDHKGTKHFPSVETDVSVNWASWVASHPLYTRLEKPKHVTVRPGTVEIITHTIQIPALAIDPPDAPCIDNNNQPCDVSSLAGGTEGKDAWKNKAYFALKVFSEIRAIGGPDAKAEAKWGKGDTVDANERAGLWLEVLNPDGSRDRMECLGGRVESDQVGSDGWTGYNLWTRGPKGATGGPKKNASCPSKKNEHQDIWVPRGGSVKIIAYLKAHKDRDPIEANVNFAWFFDNYERNYRKDTTAATCKPVFRPGRGSSECIKAEHCGLSPEWKTSTCAVDFLEDHTQSTCKRRKNSVEFFPPEPKFSYRVPVCDNNWHIDPHNTAEKSPEQFPEVFSELQKNSKVAEVKLTVCKWEEVNQTGNVDVGSVPDNCPLAVPEKVVHACQDAPVGVVNEIEDCRGIDAIKFQWQKSTASINNAQNTAPNHVVFPEEVELSWDGGTKNRWVESWTPPEYNGSPITGGALRVKTDNKLQNEKHLIRAFEREIAPTWIEPSPSNFLESIKSEKGNKKGDWDDYARHASRNVKVVDQGEKEVNITSVYPFNKATPEIYWGQRVLPPKYDFDLDGEVDVECSASYDKFESLESMLRHYASSVHPETVESQGQSYVYKFNGGETHGAVSLLGVTTEQRGRQVDKCIPTITMKNPSPGKNDKLVSLGRSDEKPVGCGEGTYLGCYPVSTGEGATLEELIKDTDYETAILAGVAEISAVFPQAHYANKCEDSDKRCYSIEIDDREPDRMKVLVRYNVPLEFPFNKFIQSDTIVAYSLKDEIQQIATIR